MAFIETLKQAAISSPITLADQQELPFLRNAIIDFTRSEPTLISRQFANRKLYVRPIIPEQIKLTVVRKTNGHWSDPLFTLIYDQLQEDERQQLESNKTTVVMIRRLQPNKEFHKAFQQHANINHQGILSLARETAPVSLPLSNEYDVIKFYSLGNDPKTNQLIEKINILSNKYEDPYHVSLAIKNIAASRNMVSLLAILSSLPLEKGLESVTRIFGNTASQIIAQALGEATEILAAAGDRISDLKIDEQPIGQMIGQVGQSIKHLDVHQLKDFVTKIRYFVRTREQKNQLTKRLITLGASLSVIAGLTELSHLTGNLVPYAAISAINATLINGLELLERAGNFSKVDITQKQLDDLYERLPRNIQKMIHLAQKHISPQTRKGLIVALNEFTLNEPAVGNYLGALASSLLFLPMVEVARKNGIPMEVPYILSGMVIQSLSSLAFGLKTIFSDPYKQVLKEVKKP